jgi:hypothetical protein
VNQEIIAALANPFTPREAFQAACRHATREELRAANVRAAESEAALRDFRAVLSSLLNSLLGPIVVG